MSGGHFGDCSYPYFKEAEEILESIEAIKSMVDYCREHNKQEIADELDKFLIHLISVKHSIQCRLSRIRELMKAVDYEASGDCSWEVAEKELKKLLGLEKNGGQE